MFLQKTSCHLVSRRTQKAAHASPSERTAIVVVLMKLMKFHDTKYKSTLLHGMQGPKR
jgi:hypothetical protein